MKDTEKQQIMMFKRLKPTNVKKRPKAAALYHVLPTMKALKSTAFCILGPLAPHWVIDYTLLFLFLAKTLKKDVCSIVFSGVSK